MFPTETQSKIYLNVLWPRMLFFTKLFIKSLLLVIYYDYLYCYSFFLISTAEKYSIKLYSETLKHFSSEEITLKRRAIGAATIKF